VFDMLMVILLCFSLKVADVSLSESGHLVPWWLTSHSYKVSIVSPKIIGTEKEKHSSAGLVSDSSFLFWTRSLSEKQSYASGIWRRYNPHLLSCSG
jgi:hypothetical protein